MRFRAQPGTVDPALSCPSRRARRPAHRSAPPTASRQVPRPAPPVPAFDRLRMSRPFLPHWRFLRAKPRPSKFALAPAAAPSKPRSLADGQQLGPSWFHPSPP